MAQLIIAGTATPAQVLSTAKFSAGTNYNVSGTMVNHTTSIVGTQDYIGTTGLIGIKPPVGYWPGNVSAYITDNNFIVGNIRGGVNVLGITGSSTVVDVSDTSLGSTGQMLSSVSVYNNLGTKVTGTMVYTGGLNTIAASVNGTATVGRLYMNPATSGFYDNSSSIYSDDANFIAANIMAGKSMFGLNGTGPTKFTATGSVSLTIGTTCTAIVNNLNFTPTQICLSFLWYTNVGNTYYYQYLVCYDNSTYGSYWSRSYTTTSTVYNAGGTSEAATPSTTSVVPITNGFSFQMPKVNTYAVSTIGYTAFG